MLACDLLHRLAAAYNFDRPEAIDQAAFLDALTSLRVCTPPTSECLTSYAVRGWLLTPSPHSFSLGPRFYAMTGCCLACVSLSLRSCSAGHAGGGRTSL